MEPSPANAPESIQAIASSLSINDHLFIESLTFNSVPIALDRKIYQDNPHIERHPYDLDPDFARIRTPYNPDAFEAYLRKANILNRYPELAFKLKHGFSLGPIPPLLASFTPDNPPYVYEHAELIEKYIADEITLTRFSGPFSKSILETKIGPFRSSPIQVAVVDNGPDVPRKYRCCRNLSFKGRCDDSVNDLIDSSNFHTRWYTAIQCAEIVRLNSHFVSFIIRSIICVLHLIFHHLHLAFDLFLSCTLHLILQFASCN
jgi:hypothetical protein